MEQWVIVFLTVFLLGTSGEHSLECTPGATIPHPTDCSKYYICDAEYDHKLFECPWDQLFNPMTTSCELADEVTCFIVTNEDETTKSVEVSDESYREDDEEGDIAGSRQEEEPDQHKQFYLIEDSSNEASKMEEPDKSNDSNLDKSSQRFDSNHSDGEENEYNGEDRETDKGNAESILLDSSERALDEEPHDSEESDKFNSELPCVSHELFGPEKSEEDHDEFAEKDTDQTKLSYEYTLDTAAGEPYSVDDLATDDDEHTDGLKKREAIEYNSNSEVIESVVEGEETEDSQHSVQDVFKNVEDGHTTVEDDHHNVEDGHHNVEVDDHNVEDGSHSVEGDHPSEDDKHNAGDEQHNVEDDNQNVEDERKDNVTLDKEINTEEALTTSTNSELYTITSESGTNILRYGSLSEPIANWTETVENGWTDLQIFWKHPKDEDFQGSVQFKYPTESMSENLEIQNLILEILKLGDKAEVLTGTKVNEEISQVTNDKKTETT